MFKLKSLLFTTFFCGILYTAWSQEKVVLNVSPAQVLILRKQAEICGEKFGVDPKSLRKILTWTLPNDDPHVEFLNCIFVTAGYHEENGQYKVDEMLTFTPLNGTRDLTVQYIKECNGITPPNRLQAVLEKAECFHKHFIPVLEKPSPS